MNRVPNGFDHTTIPRNLRHCSHHLPPSLHDLANVIDGFPTTCHFSEKKCDANLRSISLTILSYTFFPEIGHGQIIFVDKRATLNSFSTWSVSFSILYKLVLSPPICVRWFD